MCTAISYYKLRACSTVQMDVRARLATYRKEKQPASKETEESELPPADQSCVDQTHSNQEHRVLISQEEQYKYSSSWWLTVLKVVLWFLVWGFFIEVEFGVVYFIVSALVFLVVSLRGSRNRAPGELSAYSVFNKNCEAIEGTLTAEQFEREIRYGPSSV